MCSQTLLTFTQRSVSSYISQTISSFKHNMVTFSCLSFVTFLFVLSITSLAPTASAEEFKVGGPIGWRPLPPNETEIYTRWAESLRFHVGDSLRFEYKNDSVLVVDKYGYYHCNSTQPISVFDDGNTVIHLERPGPYYFVSADPEKCRNGQRLIVEVISPHQISPAASPSSNSGPSFSVLPEEVLFYVVLVGASINM